MAWSDIPVVGQVRDREGTVLVSNANHPDTSEAAWICLRYPGYKTPEEIAEAEEAKRRLI